MNEQLIPASSHEETPDKPIDTQNVNQSNPDDGDNDATTLDDIEVDMTLDDSDIETTLDDINAVDDIDKNDNTDNYVDEHADEEDNESEHEDEHADDYMDEHEDEHTDDYMDEHEDEHADEHADDYMDEHEEEQADEEEPEEEQADEVEPEEVHEHDEHLHDKRSSSLSSLEAQVEALRQKARSLEEQHEIRKEDMITLNITLKGMHKELEAACNKMRGSYNKQLNQCQIDVTDNLSKVVMSILTKPPQDKEAENHQVSFAKHAPALFLGQPKIHQSPTTIVLKRIFAIPKTSFAPNMSPFSRPMQSPYESSHCPCVNHSNMPCSPRARMYPPSMQQPSMHYPSMPQPHMASGYSPFVYPMARHGPAYYPYTARQFPAYGGNPKKHACSRRQRKPSQKGGGNCSPTNQRLVYDAQGQMGSMQPIHQGGQRFVFPYAVETVMPQPYIQV